MIENPVRSPIVPPIKLTCPSTFTFLSFSMLSNVAVSKKIWTTRRVEVGSSSPAQTNHKWTRSILSGMVILEIQGIKIMKAKNSLYSGLTPKRWILLTHSKVKIENSNIFIYICHNKSISLRMGFWFPPTHGFAS